MKEVLLSHLSQYEALGFYITHIPNGEKGPVHTGWTEKATSYKHWTNGGTNDNIGLLHGPSRILCYDIDDVETAYQNKKFKEFLQTGLQYTSGKANRLKVLFRIPKKFDIKHFVTRTLHNGTKVLGQVRCVSASGVTVQDVLPPSLHPEGTTYKWVSDLPNSFKEIPAVPKTIYKDFKNFRKQHSKIKQRYQSKHLAYYVKVYNDWFYNNPHKDFLNEIERTNGYDPVHNGFRRKGSTNKISIMIYHDEEGVAAYNYSDTPGQPIPPGPIDPYSLLVVNRFGGDEIEARRWVCTHEEMKHAIDKANVVENNNLLIDDGIRQHTDHMPYLSMEVMQPPNSNFGRLVQDLTINQEAVYNPDMAFWYAPILIDYVAGCGYQSVFSNRCAPLYSFTAGSSSDGKSTTIQAGRKYLLALGAIGNATKEEAHSKPERDPKDEPYISNEFLNKKHITRVGSSQGFEDAITKGMDHGCDILYTQDEYGLHESGKMDKAGKDMRALILTLRTLSRHEDLQERLKAVTAESKKSKGKDTYCVHVNYFTSATIETLKGVISDGEVGMGYIQRFIGGAARTDLYFRPKTFEEFKNQNYIKPDKKIVKLFDQIIKCSNKVMGLDRIRDGYKIHITDEAEVMFHRMVETATNQKDPMRKKVAENVAPLARARAIIENPKKPVLTCEYLVWANTIVTCSIMYFKWLIGELKNDHKKPATYDQVYDRIHEYFQARVDRKGNTPETYQFFRKSIKGGSRSPIDSKMLREVFDHLVEDGVILQEIIKQPSGQVGKKFYWGGE